MLNFPPSNVEKYLYINTNKTDFYLASLVSTVILLSGIFLFSFSEATTLWYLVYGLILLVYLGLSFAIGLFSKPFNLAHHEFFDKKEPEVKPSIDVFLPSCGEPLEIITSTILAAKEMAKFYGRATLHILDDAKNPELKAFAEMHHIGYITRGDGTLKKAGNVRNAFKITVAEWILILDADFTPRIDMLDEMVATIDDDVAIIQTPQFFRVEKSMSDIERGAGFVQELFYRLIQVNRNHFGAPVCVGTCALYRRKALEPFGGTAPIGYSEDLHTGFLVMTHGWKVKYFPINLAAGLCPDTLKAYFSQQYRWCMGSITLMSNPEFWKAKKITMVQKACFLTGMLYYVATGFSVALTALPSILVLWFYPHLASKYAVLFSVPSLLVGTVVISLWSKHKFGLYALEARHLVYWAHLFAIVDKVRGNIMPWTPTGNVHGNTRYIQFKWAYALFTLSLCALLVGGLIKNRAVVAVIPMVILMAFYRFLDLRILMRLFLER